MNQAEIILFVVKVWGGFGGLIAVPFLIFGIDQVDEDAKGAYVFRPLLFPGILLIWPFVLWRWYLLALRKDVWSRRYRPRRKSHQWFALAMPIAIVGIIGAGLSVRQTWPVDVAPVQLSTPAETTQ